MRDSHTLSMSPMEYSDHATMMSSRNPESDRKLTIGNSKHRTIGNSNIQSSNISQVVTKPTHKSGQQSLTNATGLKLNVTKHRRNHTKIGGTVAN